MAEVSLYDATGHPVAYIASDGETIYTWRGHAVAYLRGERVYGWNGHHLGWWHNGVMYDLHGRRVGYRRNRCPLACYAAPAKYAKYAKYARHAPYAKAALSTARSSESLADFLRRGAVGSAA